jgi:hypothetical protein
MYLCRYDLRSGGRGCPNERTLDYEFCQPHLDTPRGRAHIMEVIQRGRLTLPSEVERAIEKAKEIPEEDYHTTALERMAEALETIQNWVNESRANMDTLSAHEYRYKDRAGQEQLRSEVAIFERALDRLSKHLGAMSKVSLQDKLVSLGKSQVDMMIRMIMTVVTELRLDEERAKRAQTLLLDLLERDGNLSGRVDVYAHKQLESAPDDDTINATQGYYYAPSDPVRR